MRIANKLLLIVMAVSCFSTSNATEVRKVPVEHFGKIPEISNVQISLDGSKVLMLENRAGDQVLVTRKLDASGQAHTIEAPQGKFNWAIWGSDNRILASVRDIDYVDRTLSAIKRREHYLYVMDWDGSGIKNANKFRTRHRAGRRSVRASPQYQDQLIDILKNDPQHVLLQLDIDKPGEPGVYKLNIETRKRTRVLQSRRSVDLWVTDQNHVVRYGEGNYEPEGQNIARHVAFYRKSKDSPWITLFDYNELEDRRPFYFEGFSEDPNIVYILADDENGVRSLYTYDVDRKMRIKKLIGDDQKNIVDVAFNDDLTLKHHVYYHDQPDVIWHGERGEKIDKIIDEHFHGRAVSIPSESKDKNKVIFEVASPTMPITYYYVDLTEMTVMEIGRAYSELDRDKLSDKHPIFYLARDGLEIPGYLSLPSNGSKNLPTIILPHGGPMGRDLWDFDYWTQFLTSRGYAVLQMNYRGSTGYGEDFRFKGYHEWGRKMLRDINDGTRHLIDQGIADPDNICIMGGSYGGYAALQSIALKEEQYKCAVAFAPVTNLPAMMRNLEGATGLRSYRDYVESDHWTMEEASPINHIEKFDVPVLLMQGEEDVNVPVSQARSFFDRMQDAGKEIKYIELEGGDHFLSDEKHRIQFLEEIEAFLNAHLN